jgi:hypothetical protein
MGYMDRLCLKMKRRREGGKKRGGEGGRERGKKRGKKEEDSKNKCLIPHLHSRMTPSYDMVH